MTDADGDGVISAGDTLAYSITLTNNGDAAATGVTICDDYGEVLVTVSAISASGIESLGVIDWSSALSLPTAAR